MPVFDLNIPDYIARALQLPSRSPRMQQLRTLRKLLRRARFTEFGQQYHFDEILMSRHIGKSFQQKVPMFTYNRIFNEWWHRSLDGKPDVTWPGVIKYFALSSGTSEAASKYIPITKELIRSNTITSTRQLLSLARYDHLPTRAIGKGWLMLGGSTQLQRGPTYYAGDLSGIQQKNIPFWFTGLGLYKPGKKIAGERDWAKKLDEIVENAPNWDIGFIIGVPAWLQLCMEKIVERYNLKTIHDLWPNLGFYVHGGVSIEPYRKSLNRLFGKPMVFIETYLASEGFLAYQTRQETKGMQLVLNNNIFFEFVLFNDENFDADGNMNPGAEALMIHDIEENKDYALLISTNAGTWRYLIGDTVRLIDRERSEIIITGRTKHFLSLVGEHLSVDNMNKAIEQVSEDLNISIPEFSVAGVPHGTFFGHLWYIATDDEVNEEELANRIDEKLKVLNDDYAVERAHALQDIKVQVLKEDVFLKFLEVKGKMGGQHKFPRVLKGHILSEWKEFLVQDAVF